MAMPGMSRGQFVHPAASVAVRVAIAFRDVGQAVSRDAASDSGDQSFRHFVAIDVERPLRSVVIQNVVRLAVFRPFGVDMIREDHFDAKVRPFVQPLSRN
ncbi:hypothetical protein EV132_1029 [Rhizobium sullae]|uniref:Uncharacterized protein n=1 Tax=Rhizobium sullae TaxID=50338 RepID=A0A4R3QD71_RHISU|nr:hypothetical protein EV132_1029 [Rhizobium sullae]